MAVPVTSNGPPARLVRHDDIALIVLDAPPVNALGRSMRAALCAAIEMYQTDDGLKIAVLVGAGKNFSAGADIGEFSAPPSPPLLPDLIAQMDAIDKPLAAMMHGAALGGGLELALGCHYRAVFSGAKLGLPEVNLGIIPGAGGTQRLPRLIGTEAALDMIPTGKVIDAERALALGLIEQIAEAASAEAAALAFARDLLTRQAPVRRVSALPNPDLPDEASAGCRARLTKRDPDAFAPFRALEAVAHAARLPFDEGLKQERAMFLDCLQTPQRAGLVHAFFAEKRATKAAGSTGGVAIEHTAVVGGGRMGAGIAWCFAAAGMPVKILEADPAALEAALTRARGFAEQAVRRGRMREAEALRHAGLIEGATDYAALADADLIIEAVTEDMSIKRSVFGELSRVCKPDAILATNTSSLDLNELANCVASPENFAGMHFFNPAPAMKLLEVASTPATSQAVPGALIRVGRRLGKIPVAVGGSPGFVGNRMAFAYGREAELLLEEGAEPEQVDRVMRGFGMAMGPLETRDLAGIDNGWNIRRLLWRDLPPAFPRPRVLDALHQAKRMGRACGAGYYRYPAEGGPLPDPETARLLEQVRAQRGITARKVTDDEILMRCLCALVNEGAQILEEGIAARPGDIDTIFIRGFGFPARRGGPMFWADGEGLGRILERVRDFHRSFGAWWTPAPLLVKLGETGGTFAPPDSD